MKKKKILPLLVIFTVLLLLMSSPKGVTEKLRGMAASLSAPIWQLVAKVKMHRIEDGEVISKEEFLQLSLENQLLKKNLENAHSFLQEAFARHKGRQNFTSETSALQLYRLEAVPAEVIYRSPTTWNSSLWINRGHATNREVGKEVIARNSPVVAGHALIGVIDYVGEKQSRVRLITDSGLSVAVRAARGHPQNQRLSESIDLLLGHIVQNENSRLTAPQKKQLLSQLKALQKIILEPRESLFLAKGELHGSSPPLWRSKGQFLKGVGFNYDFADEDGPARDLRSGIPYGAKNEGEPLELLKINDILVTSGMDGIFPAGLQVAEVASIGALEEGDYAYELLALPIAGRLDELSLLFVMPPLGYDPSDQPELGG